MAELERQDQVQARFDLAVQHGVSPCLWLPPEWNALEDGVGGKMFPNTSFDKGSFEEPAAEAARVERLKKGRAKDSKDQSSPESPPTEEGWTSPFADTSHIDETEFSAADQAKVKDLLKNEQELFKKLDRIVGPQSFGMQRLARIFEWVLYRATVHMGDLNENLRIQNPSKYDEARANYINFLRDLDDHEPEKGPKQTPLEKEEGKPGRPKTLDVKDKASASGYGRSIKWTCIDPVIFGGEIIGARIVGKWNPHVSSSGIAIEH